MLKIKKKRILS